jgi:hypothetical protein
LGVILNTDGEECKENINTSIDFFKKITITASSTQKDIYLAIGYKITTQGKEIRDLMDIINNIKIVSTSSDGPTNAGS